MRLKPDPGMASPAGLTLIAPKPRTVAVLLPDRPSADALALASWADAGAGVSPEAARATKASETNNLFVRMV